VVWPVSTPDGNQICSPAWSCKLDPCHLIRTWTPTSSIGKTGWTTSNGSSAHSWPSSTPSRFRRLNVYLRAFVLTALVVDGIISAIFGAALLNTRFGGVLVPLGLVISAVLNVVLVWCALQWAPSTRWSGAPLWAFVATTTLLLFGGPGGDVIFSGFGPVLLLALGVLPAAYVLRRANA